MRYSSARLNCNDLNQKQVFRRLWTYPRYDILLQKRERTYNAVVFRKEVCYGNKHKTSYGY